jgi:hypothetical protein
VILVDTSVWVDHFRRGDGALRSLLEAGEVSAHPFVIGELACGRLARRREVLTWLGALPSLEVVDHEEALGFVERHALEGRGIGWVDVHLLASAALARTRLWTRDRALRAVAGALELEAAER